jgi:hypothetical protein
VLTVVAVDRPVLPDESVVKVLLVIRVLFVVVVVPVLAVTLVVPSVVVLSV